MDNKAKIAAGNVEIPAYLALLQKGYEVRREDDRINKKETWHAQKDGHEFISEGLIELLGVVNVFETRGMNWKATDTEIDNFLNKYK